MKAYLLSYIVIDGLNEYRLKSLIICNPNELEQEEKEIIEDYSNDQIQERAVKDIQFKELNPVQVQVLQELGI
jgi:hypothetical protein